MAMCQGPQRKVVHIGLGLKQMLIQPPGATAIQYAESLAHKVTFFQSCGLVTTNPSEMLLAMS